MKDVTRGAHPRKFCFVLGAGTSRNSGIKSGQELVQIWDRELRERNEEDYLRWRSELGITDKNMSSFYSQYYEKRFQRCPADGYNYIEKIMDTATPSVGYVMLSHMLTKTPHNVVITTNFDHLTEDTINYYTNATPLVIGHEVLAHYISGQPVRPTIIKIHRDLLFDPKSRTNELEALPESWKHALGRVFENYHPVFIGYAGNDKSLMDFLVENGRKFADDEWKFPYWMLYRGDAIEGKVKEFLEKSQGYYVEHEGFDDVMIALGANFDYRIPQEEDFLEDARKRYAKLKDAIDEYSTRERDKAVVRKEEQERKSNSEDAKDQETQISEEQREDRNSVNQAIDLIAGQTDEQRLFREATVLRDKRDYEKACVILGELVERYPMNARYMSEYGYNLFMADKYEEAEKVLKKAISMNGKDSLSHYCLGEIYRKRGEVDRAIDHYNQSLKIDPQLTVAYLGRGDLWMAKHDYDSALEDYQTCVEVNPVWGLSYQRVSKALSRLGRNEEALVAIDKAIELDPKYINHYRQKAEVLALLDRHEEAEEVRDMIRKLEREE